MEPSFAQKGMVKGRITDKDSKEAIPFASVVLENKGIQEAGTTADRNGEFIIKANPSVYTLKVAYVGYKVFRQDSVKVRKNDTTVVNIVLTPTTTMLREVKVLDYSVPLFSKDMSTSGGTVTSEEIISMRSPSLESTSTGKRAGGKMITPGVGILTAGEINDFSKWDLWEDIKSKDLKTWQDYWEMAPTGRFTFQVITKRGKPVVDAIVSLQSAKGYSSSRSREAVSIKARNTS